MRDGMRRLLGWQDVPRHLQFNPYIHRGYRPVLSCWGCVQSLGYLHNETVNILTHVVPFLATICLSPWLFSWDSVSVPVLPYLHILALVTPWLGSVVYHLFMNHHWGSEFYTWLLQLDMLGIWFTHCVGALTTILATVYCLPWLAQLLIVCVFIPYCGYGVHRCVNAGTVVERRLCFMGMMLVQFLALVSRPIISGGSPHSFSHYLRQDIWAVLGAVIGAVRVPERWLPGRFDNVFNSHHIMHVMVVVAVYHMHQAATHDFLWMSHHESCL